MLSRIIISMNFFLVGWFSAADNAVIILNEMCNITFSSFHTTHIGGYKYTYMIINKL